MTGRLFIDAIWALIIDKRTKLTERQAKLANLINTSASDGTSPPTVFLRIRPHNRATLSMLTYLGDYSFESALR